MSTTDHIPLVDLHAQHAEIAEEFATGCEAVLDATAFVGGPDVDAFEEEFAAFCGARHCVGVANGTDAIELMLLGLRHRTRRRGDRPRQHLHRHGRGGRPRRAPRSCSSTATSEHLLIDPDSVAELIGPRTRAVIGVHLYGQIAPFERLRARLRRRDVVLLEDAAQSQGATRHGQPIGTGVRGRGDELLPGQEPRRLRRRRRRAHRRRGARRAACGRSHATAVCDATSTATSASTRGSTRSRPWCCERSCARLAGWNAATPGRRRPLRRPARRTRDQVRRPVTAAGQRARVAPLRRAGPRPGPGARGAAAPPASAPAIHYPTPIHLTEAFADLGSRLGTFPVAEECRADAPVAAAAPPHHCRTSRSAWWRRSRRRSR